MKEVLHHNSPRKEKKNQKLSGLVEQYLNSDVLPSTNDSNRENKKKRKREKDSLNFIHKKKKKVKVEIDDDTSTITKINEDLEVESSSDSNIKIKKKKIKTETGIKENDEFDDSHILNMLNDKHKKKKKKKHKDVEISNSSLDESVYDNVDDLVIKSKKIKIESEDKIKYTIKQEERDVNPHDNYVLNVYSIKNKKKKKKKKDVEGLNGNYIDDIDKKDITKKTKIITESIDIKNEEQYLEKHNQLLDVDNSVNDVDNISRKKKKKKHKNLDTDEVHSDDLLKSETKDKMKVKVKSEVIETETEDKNRQINHKSSTYPSTELKFKKAKVKIKYENSDNSDADYYSSDVNVESKKKIKKEAVVAENMKGIEDRKKSKKKHSKKIEDKVLERDAPNLEEKNETESSLEKGNDGESFPEGKSKKKKHKRSISDSIQSDAVVKEIDAENTELAELRKKKKKKKKHSVELPEEKPCEPVLLDLDFLPNNKDQGNEDKPDNHNYKKKKKKKHKNKKNSVEIVDETDSDSSSKKSKKKKKVCQEKNSENEENNYSENSSGFESDEGDYSESERVPRVNKQKSIYAQYPKVARMMKESEDDDDLYPHLQYRRVTLTEALQLANLKIQLRHTVPPQHQIEKYAGTRNLTLDQKEEFEKYIKIRKGRFNSEEDRRIVHNWKKFCKKHGWRRSIIYPFLHEKRKGFFYVTTVEERKKFVQFLANGLPDRSLYSVYYRFRTLYSTHKTSRYTKDEDEIILNEVKDLQGRNRFSILARKLNRTRASVWRRYKLLVKKKKGSDSEDETIV